MPSPVGTYNCTGGGTIVIPSQLPFDFMGPITLTFSGVNFKENQCVLNRYGYTSTLTGTINFESTVILVRAGDHWEYSDYPGFDNIFSICNPGCVSACTTPTGENIIYEFRYIPGSTVIRVYFTGIDFVFGYSSINPVFYNIDIPSEIISITDGAIGFGGTVKVTW